MFIYTCVQELQKIARKVSYNEYLCSIYWKTIKRYLLYIHRQCYICKKRSRLTVHHKTYNHFGYEIFHLEDLQVLCWFCHINERKKSKLYFSKKIGKEI